MFESATTNTELPSQSTTASTLAPTPHLPGLKRIILVGSYLNNPSKNIIEFDLTRDTQINGKNGTGKTSLLKLIPFFYGREPGRISSSSNVKKSFSSFYLPYDNSAIIFEYYNNKGEVVHVAVTNASTDPNSTSINYYFFNVPFDVENIFQPFEIATGTGIEYRLLKIKDNSRNNLDYDTVLRNRRDNDRKQNLDTPYAKLHTKVANTIDDYRTIIQNLSLDKKSYNFQPRDRMNFSLSSGNKKIRYIDSITHSLITGRVDFDKIKLLISEIMKDQDVKTDEIIPHEQLEAFCVASHSYDVVYGYKNNVQQTLTTNEQLVNNYRSLKHNITELNYYHKNLEAQYIDLDNTINDLKDSLTKYKADTNAILTEKQNKISNFQDRIKGKQEVVDELEKQHERFINEDAQHWINEFTKRNDYQEQLKLEQEQYEAMTEGFKTIQNTFEKDLASAKQQCDSIINAQKEKLHHAEQECKDAKHKIDNQKLESTNKLNSQFQEYKNKVEREINDCQNQIKIVELQCKNPELDPALQKQCEELKQLKDQYTQELLKEQVRSASLQQDIFNNRNEVQHLYKQKSIINNRYLAIKKELDRIVSYIDPRNDMFSYALIENIPAWQSTIGRVIKPELLQNNRLQPRFELQSAEQDSARLQIGNLSIDISSLEDFDLDIPNLEAQQHKLMQEQNQLQTQITTLDNKINEIEKIISSLEYDKRTTDATITDYKKKLTSTLDTLTRVESELLHQKTELQQQLQQQIKALQQQQKQKETQKQNLNAQQQESLQQINNTYLANKSDIETKFDSAKEDIDNAIKVATDTFTRRKTELDAIRKAALQNKQIDEKIITTKEQQIQHLKDLLQSIKDHDKLITDYYQWSLTGAKRLPEERNQLDELNNELRTKQVELHKFKEGYKQEVDIRQSKINSTQQQQTIVDGNFKDCTNLIAEMQNEEKPVLTDICYQRIADTASLSVETLVIQTRNIFENYKQQVKDVDAQLEELENKIRKFQISTKNSKNGSIEQSDNIYAIWLSNKTIAQGEPSLNLQVDDTDEFKERMQKAYCTQKLFEEVLPRVKEELLSRAKLFADFIRNFHMRLQEFDQHISSLSTKISRTIRTNLQFDAFENFDVKLRSRLEKLAGHDNIKRVAMIADDWAKNGYYNKELAPLEFVDTLAVLNHQCENGHLGGDIQDLFDVEFSVVENGAAKKATNARELEELSSNGLTFLLICALYISLIVYARNNQNIQIHWPVDEMAKLSSSNIDILLQTMHRNNILMISANPELHSQLATAFKVYLLSKNNVYTGKPQNSALAEILGVNND